VSPVHMSLVRMKWSALALVSVAGFVALTSVRLRSAPVVGEWRAYNGDYASTRYSPLDQINRDTVKNLKVVWRQSLTPDVIKEGRDGVPPPPVNNETTPLMVGGLVYFSTGIGGVAAVDAATGKVVWHVDSSRSNAPAADVPDPDNGGPLAGSATRGISYWTDGRDERIIALIGGRYLTALNAKTGTRYPDFGEGGEVDLRKGQERGVTTFSSHRADGDCSGCHDRWLERHRYQ
jgi:quinoprotein glucose dehydrogenase